MAKSTLCYGIPDVRLARLLGGKINPSSLVGRELVVIFCPVDPAAAAAEIGEYRKHANAFTESGASLIGVVDDAGLSGDDLRGEGVLLTRDPENTGWLAFSGLLPPADRPERAAGGAFYFGRGGCLVRFWLGGHHAGDALGAIERRL